MDWGIDPERVAELAEIIRNRRLPAADAEKVILAIVGGGGENVDQPLWDLAQILFCLGHLAAQPRMGPRDAATACLLDESGLITGPIRRASKTMTVGVFRISGGPEGVSVTSPEGERGFAWSRVKRAMAIGDFLFNSPYTDPAAGNGVDALRLALDTLFLENASLTDLSKRAVQAPARYMRAWRKKFLPLQAFAELIRVRETYLAERNRTREGRALDADDVFEVWTLALARGETWSFARYVEKLAALIREERTDAERRAFLQPVAIDALVTGEPSEDPETAIIAWLDRDMESPAAISNDNLPDADPPEHDHPDAPIFEERTLAALNALPEAPKVLTKEERRQAASVFALSPLCHEQPLTLLRALQAAGWENRLVEASRRGATDIKGGTFDYAGEVGGIRVLDQRFGELILMGIHLAARSTGGRAAEEGSRILKKWRHDRSSFRIEDAKLAQSFAMMGHDLRVTAQALRRVLQQMGRLAPGDLATLSVADAARFGQVFATRYNRQAES
jgi:hypothetical protein